MFLTLIAVLASAWPAAAAASQPPCQRRCGDVDIPYPFGVGRGCYLYTGENDVTFGLTCNLTAAGTYRPFCFDVEVLGVSVARGQARVRNEINPWCYNGTSRSMDQRSRMWTDFSDSSFMLSDEDNRFTVVGCNSLAYVRSVDTSQFSTSSTYMTGCMATCPGDAARQLENGSCSGMGCCQTAIPRGINSYVVAFEEKFNTTAIVNFSRCSYAVLVEATWFDFRATYVTAGNFMASTGGKVPLVLDWVVGKVTCREAMRNTTAYACISSNSVCVDSRNGPGYLCNCSRGYQGNPYLQGGCRDIDECGDGGISYPCSVPGTCINTHGGFRCACPRGYRGNPRIKDGCIKSSLGLGLSVGIGIGSGAGLLILVFGAIFVTRKIKHRRARALKHQFFRQNRGHLLQQLVSQKADIAERMIIPLAELERATNNFDKAREIGGGGHGLVYKGIMSDQHVVAIKKSKVTVRREIDEFINEVAILSQINHLNVVKLFGCCLETEVPLLVYEFISNGTLYHHLHVEEPNRSLPWVDRVRIATETARALAYLHLAVSVPIVHRDIKSQNILLDGTLVAKVSDFGASRCIPVDQTGDETAIQGTFGYLDPLYFYSGQLSEQSDVYSFGVLLMELLTRKKPCSYRSSEDKSLVACFTALLEQGGLANLLDPQVVMEGGKKVVDDVAMLAAACVRMEGAQRPTMRQVEMALESLRVPHESIVISDKKDTASCAVIEGTIAEEVSRQYSLEEEYLLSSRYPR